MQTMDTAPTDGTPILAYVFNGKPAVVWHHSNLPDYTKEIHESIGLSSWGNDHFFLYERELTGWFPLPKTN